jgi:hypothetical protein
MGNEMTQIRIEALKIAVANQPGQTPEQLTHSMRIIAELIETGEVRYETVRGF